MKTVKQEETISRSRFVDCPVCNNHTLKLKRTVQVGRCKSCNETYKIIIVYVKAGKKTKPQSADSQVSTEKKTELSPSSGLPAWQLPSDSSLFGNPSESYPGLSEAVFGPSQGDRKTGEASSGSSQ